MIDSRLLTQNPDLLRDTCRRRQIDPSLIDRLLKVDSQRRQLIQDSENIKTQQNKLARSFSGKPDPHQIKQGKNLKLALSRLEPDSKAVQQEFNHLLLQIPNLPARDVPEGKNDSQNVKIKTWGEIPKFKFKPQDHVALGEALDIIDIRRAAKVSGTRMGYFKAEAAVLEMALLFWVFQSLTKKGFRGNIPPVIFKKEMEWKMGYQADPDSWPEMYQFPEDGLVLASSSEHTVIPMHADEVLTAKELPLRYVNFSSCFRREAGSYGKDNTGLFRVHQFNKVEMNVFTTPDLKISDQETLSLLREEEEIVQALGLPYQVMNCCTGDLPQPNRRMYDLEVWFPGQGRFRETHSCSNCTDYQTRRLNIKTRLSGKLEFVHALNATAATDRLVLAILENNQKKDGSIEIPKVLRPLTGFSEIKPKHPV